MPARCRRPASARSVALGGFASGTVNLKTDPFPGSLVTVISPPIFWTSCLQIDRPRPVPPWRRDDTSETWVKGSKM